jgi:hypothetical protein
VKKFPLENFEGLKTSIKGGRLLSLRFFAMGPQIIVEEVRIDPARYVDEQFQRRVLAPSECPNCGKAQALEAHG